MIYYNSQLKKNGDDARVKRPFIIGGVRNESDNIDRDTHDHDLTYENEQSMVTIEEPLKEYDKLKERKGLKNILRIQVLLIHIDKIEELTRD